MELFKHASVALFWTAGAASIVGLLLPATGWKARLMHVVYGVFIAALAVGVAHYRGRVSETERIETQANAVASTFDKLGHGHRGFMLAALAFLEKHKDRLPDTFARAQALCDNAGVTSSAKSNFSAASEQRRALAEAAEAMRALLLGLAAGKL